MTSLFPLGSFSYGSDFPVFTILISGFQPEQTEANYEAFHFYF